MQGLKERKKILESGILSLTPDSDLPVDETVKQAAGAGIRL
jgi:hypothetical protein